MTDRKLIIKQPGYIYDTASDGRYTLAAFNLSKPTFEENYVKVPGRSGHLDLSTVLTDGEPSYANRPFTARLESSEGTRLEREARINSLINKFDGYLVDIVLPDDPTHYITGRISITKEYNDIAHAAVNVKATCEPWRYSSSEAVITVTASSSEQSVTLINGGRMPVIPTVTISGGTITLAGEGWSRVLTEGTYTLPDIYIKTGSVTLTYKGSGSARFVYREAVL